MLALCILEELPGNEVATINVFICLFLDVVFISNNIQIWFGQLSLSLNWVRSYNWLLRYSTFNILRSSFIWGCLHIKQFSILVWPQKHKLKIWGRFDQGLLRYSTFNNLRSSFIGGHLDFNQVLILNWYPKLKFQIWGRSDQSLKFYIEYAKLWM